MTWLHYSTLAWSVFLGLLAGGFLNVFLYRIPRKESLFRCSACPSCGYPLQIWESFPVLGWLLLLGKCRRCRTCIDVRYVFIELAGAVLYGLCCFVAITTVDDLAVFKSMVGYAYLAATILVILWATVAVLLKAGKSIFRWRYYFVCSVVLIPIFFPNCWFQFFFDIMDLETTWRDVLADIVIFTSFYAICTILGISWATQA